MAEVVGELRALFDAGIPVVAVRSVEDLFTDGHLADVEFFQDYQHPVAGTLRMPRHPIGFGGQPEPEALPAPLLGQHSETVLREAGLDETVVAALLRDGVIKTSIPHQEDLTP